MNALQTMENEQQDLEEHNSTEDFAKLLSELSESVETYCRHRPGVVAGVLFGLGFFCGWKLRPW